jgi:hypothetical protein
MRADGRTDMTKLISALRNFANVPTNVINLHAMKECGRECAHLISILEGVSSGKGRGRFYAQLKCSRYPLDMKLCVALQGNLKYLFSVTLHKHSRNVTTSEITAREVSKNQSSCTFVDYKIQTKTGGNL